MIQIRATLALALVFTLGACGTSQSALPDVSPTSTAEATATPLSPTATAEATALPMPTSEGAPPENTAVTAAQVMFAESHGVEAGAVRVISLEAVDWPDTSLGCPRPDQMYAQVIVPGYRVVLEANGQRGEIHTDATGGQLVACEA